MFKSARMSVVGVAIAAAIVCAPGAAMADNSGVSPVKAEKIQKALEKSGVPAAKILEVLNNEDLAQQVAVTSTTTSTTSFSYFGERAVNRAMCFTGGDPRRTNTYIAGNAWGAELYRFTLETFVCNKYGGGGVMYADQRTFFKTKSNTTLGSAWAVEWDGQTDNPQNCSGSGEYRVCSYWHARANVHASMLKIGQNKYPWVQNIYNSGTWSITRGD